MSDSTKHNEARARIEEIMRRYSEASHGEPIDLVLVSSISFAATIALQVDDPALLDVIGKKMVRSGADLMAMAANSKPDSEQH